MRHGKGNRVKSNTSYPELYEKWEKTGMLSGIDDPEMLRKIVQLFENQDQAMRAHPSWEDQDHPDFVKMTGDLIFPLIRWVFQHKAYESEDRSEVPLDADWDVMSMPHQKFDGDMISATTRKMVTQADFQGNEDVCTYARMCPDISMLSALQTMMRREFEQIWKGQKVWVYVPFQPMLFRPGRTIGFVTRYGCRAKLKDALT